MVCCCGNNNKADGDPLRLYGTHPAGCLERGQVPPAYLKINRDDARATLLSLPLRRSINPSLHFLFLDVSLGYRLFFLAHAFVSDIDLFIFILKLVVKKNWYWQSSFAVGRNVEKTSASDSRMNTVAAAAEGCNELMMHSQLGAPSVYSRTRRWIAGEKKEEKSFSIWSVCGPFPSRTNRIYMPDRATCMIDSFLPASYKRRRPENVFSQSPFFFSPLFPFNVTGFNFQTAGSFQTFLRLFNQRGTSQVRSFNLMKAEKVFEND